MAYDDFSAQGLQAPATQGAGIYGTDMKISFTRGSIRYDTPFLDMTSTFLPRSIKGILRFIAAYLFGDGLVSHCITKMSEYPITKLIYETEGKNSLEGEKLIEKWRIILEDKVKILRVLKQAGMDYYGYGNSLVSINFPFRRMLMCPKCKKEHASESLQTTFRAFKFNGKCITPKCGYTGEMKARDVNTKEIEKIGIVHWDLLCMDIKYNSITGDHFYFYTVPSDLAVAIRRGDMDIINTTRLEILEAVRKRRQLKLLPENVFHLKRPAPQYLIPSERGWGIPVVMPVMKDLFHIKVLKKGNEMIAFDHIVPLRILFPQGTGDVSPHATINLSGWKTKIEEEIRKFRADPNYVSVVPMPIGVANFSGDARLLLVTPEIKMAEDTVITGIGIIPEIVRGGASWSGSNVSLRVVENSFLNHRDEILNLINFIRDGISRKFELPAIKIRMSDFKMADDISKKQLMVNAALGNASQTLISKTTAIRELEFDPEVEFTNKIEEIKKVIEVQVKEAEGAAEASGSASLINAMYAADAEIANASRMEKGQRESQTQRDREMASMKDEASSGIAGEVSAMAQQRGHDPAQISLPNMILNLTQRFARLIQLDPEEYKIRMLAMKNSMPNLYQEIYNNMKEMNLIEADTSPDIATANRYTPGQIPTNYQGETNAAEMPAPAEIGASPEVVATPSVPVQATPLPEARGPRAQQSQI